MNAGAYGGQIADVLEKAVVFTETGAGKLIQDAGLQGLRIGGAEVSRQHAGFIINVDHATAKDYIELIAIIHKTIKDRFNIELETEVILLGDD